MSKVLIAYHANCIDGFTAAWVAAKAMTEQKRPHSTLPMDYTDDSRNHLVGIVKQAAFDTLYILDYSVPLDILKQLTDIVPRVVILDHHKTAFETYHTPINTEAGTYLLPTLKYGVHILLDNTRSGAGITWAYFFPDQPSPWIVRYVQDRDLWSFNYKFTKAVHAYLGTLDRTFEAWDAASRALSDAGAKFMAVAQGQAVLDKEEREIKAILAGRSPVWLTYVRDYLGASAPAYIVTCPKHLASEVGNRLALACDGIGIIVNFSDDLRLLSYSLRSVGDIYDVSAIAKQYSGGGHKNAAGFVSSKLIYLPTREES